MNKKIYKKFEGCDQIMSFRFGETLEEPINKFDTFVHEDKMIGLQEETCNYGEQNYTRERRLFVVDRKDFKIKKHLEGIDGARTAN